MKYWKNIATDIWEYNDEIRMPAGIWFTIRSIAIRLANGDLWLHSPCNFPNEGLQELKTLGNVRYIVAPNAFHHLYVPKAALDFPEAEVWCAPKVLKKQKDLKNSAILSSEVPWANEILTLPLQGLRMVEESVFFHKKSQSFICTDFVFNVYEFKNLQTKILMTLVGANQKFAQGLEWRLLVKERNLIAQNTAHILGWDFKRIIMAHGRVLETRNIRDQFADTTAWIRKGHEHLLLEK